MEKRDIRYEEEYIGLRKSIRILERKNKFLRIINTILLGGSIALTAVIVLGSSGLRLTNAALNTKVAELEKTVDASDEYNLTMTDNFNELSDQFKDASEMIIDLDDQNKELVDQVNGLNDKLAEYEAREELFDEYEYAIIREDGTRTDLTYEEIVNLKSLADELGLSDDAVNLILSVVMTESQGTEDAKNSESSATGFGQILNDTGEFVWTKLMNGGSYNHSTIASDGDNNLQLMAYYIDYLNDKYDGNATLVMKEYRGEDDTSYMKKIDKYLAKNNLSLNSVELSK